MKKKLIIAIVLCLGILSCGQRETVSYEYDLMTEQLPPVVRIPLSPLDTVAFLVDTGSDFTVINRYYYYGHKQLFKNISNEEVTIITIHGEEKINLNQVSGTIDEKFRTGFTVMDITPMVQILSLRHETLVSGILGSDFFNKNDAVIDFENNKLILRRNVRIK